MADTLDRRRAECVRRALLVEARSHDRDRQKRVQGSRSGPHQGGGRAIPDGKTPGSRTARGLVFIVFGSPARVRDEHAPPAPGGTVGAPAGALEGNETITHWIYDRERTPKVLEALDRPSFEVQIIIEPFRHSDAIESPGLVKELREKLARQTIVNPDAAVPSAGAARPPPKPRLRQPPRPPFPPRRRLPRGLSPFRATSSTPAFALRSSRRPTSRGRARRSSGTPSCGATRAARGRCSGSRSRRRPRARSGRSRASSERRTAETRSHRSPTRRVRPMRFRARRRATSTSARSICLRDPTRPPSR